MVEEITFKSGRGGARPGSGRPKGAPNKDGIPTRQVQFRLTEEEIPLMKAYFEELKKKRKNIATSIKQ